MSTHFKPKPTTITTIAIIANTTWNIYNFRLNIIEKLLSEGFRVKVIAPVDKYIIYREQHPEVEHIPLKQLARDSLNPLKDILFTWELVRIYKRIKPDIVLHYTVKPNIYGGFAAAVNGIPSIAVVTGLGYAFIHNGLVELITKVLYKLSCRFHQKVVFENQDDRILFLKSKLLKKDKGLSIKGCGVNTTYFRPTPIIPDKEKTVFTFIGRLLYDKGLKEFIQAAKYVKFKYPLTEYWLIGEIDLENPAAIKEAALQKWVKEKTIVYQGATDNIRQFIAASDCIVLPSYREGIARSITEGMSMEKIVITTNSPGCRETVEEGKNGFLVPVKDEKALAEAMIKFLQLNEEERRKMGKYGREKAVKEFDDKIIAEAIFSIIKEVLYESS